MDMSKQLLLPSTDNLPSFFRTETTSETAYSVKKPSLDLDAAPIFDLDQNGNIPYLVVQSKSAIEI